MVEIGPKPLHAGQGIADRRGKGRLARDTGQLNIQPGFQIVEDRLRLRPSVLDPAIGLRSTRFLLDRVELRDARDGLFGDGGPLGPVDVDELATDMGHEGDLSDIA